MLSWEDSQHFTASPGFPKKWHLSGDPEEGPGAWPPPSPFFSTKLRSKVSKTIFETGPSTYLKIWICHCIWGTSVEIPYWWHVTTTTKIWVVVLIGRSKFSTNQKYYSDMDSDASSVWNFYVCSSDFIFQGNQWWRHEMMAVSQIRRARGLLFFLKIY